MEKIELDEDGYALLYSEKQGLQLYTPAKDDDAKVPDMMIVFSALAYGITKDSKHIQALVDEFCKECLTIGGNA